MIRILFAGLKKNSTNTYINNERTIITGFPKIFATERDSLFAATNEKNKGGSSHLQLDVFRKAYEWFEECDQQIQQPCYESCLF